MTGKEYEALREDLASLGEDTPVPAMPDGLHQRWMELVKEDAMEHRNENAASPAAAEKKGFIRFTPKTRRLLAWAAALVFVVGGTLMTRDSLPARTTRVRANSSVQTATATAYDAGNANAVYEPMMVMEEAAPAAVEAAYGAAYSRAYDSAVDMDMAEYEAAMQGIYTTSVNAATLDESPMAYKSLADIIGVIADSVDVIEVMKPIYNFKADGDELPWKKKD